MDMRKLPSAQGVLETIGFSLFPLDTLRLALGAWRLALGARPLALGARRFAHGAWR